MQNKTINNTKKFTTTLPQELFEKIQGLNSYKEREKLLAEEGDNFTIKTILQLAYNENIKLDLPEGSPAFKRDDSPVGTNGTNYRKTLKKLMNLTSNSPFVQLKKQKIFLDILESLHEKDSEILCAAKDNRLEKLYPKVSKTLVAKVFPNLIK
jgi:hypothetical protein